VETFELRGTEAVFAPPPAPWVANPIKVGEDDGELGLPADTVTAITFRRPESEGFITVAALDQARDSEGNLIELENDQETLNTIARWVEKRNGERTEEEYIKVLGVNAFHMKFNVLENENKLKGEQVHFTKGGQHYTLSILVPAQDYDAEVGHFRDLVSSFNLKEGDGAQPTPAPE
jgi:hypothetical protein